MSPKRILIIDDEEDIREVAALALECAGDFEVTRIGHEGGRPLHRLIVAELKIFVESRVGVEVWRPDDDFRKIVAGAAERAGLTQNALLESFGEFIAPRLLSIYPALVKPEWRTLDVIEHTERAIHTVVRAEHPGAIPPYLRVHRTSPSEVIIFYDSPKRLCSVAKGIIRGLARHFGETLRITEERCMLAQAPDCTLVVSASH